MRPGFAAFLALLAVAAIAFVPAAFADDVAPADKSAMQAVVSGQITAFEHDDAAAAYAYASPGIHTVFTTPGSFMAMVKSGYGAIYRPSSVIFGAAAMVDGSPTQTVYVTGADGESFVALYRFQKQPDGSWKIDSVTIVKDDSPTI
jgi:hypothetical protein